MTKSETPSVQRWTTPTATPDAAGGFVAYGDYIDLETALAAAQEREKAAESRRAELQAKIDALVLEYCPQEMTQEQVDNWMAAQARVSPEDEARINATLAKEANHG